MTLTLFDALEAIGALPRGIERPVIEPRAAELLTEYDEHVRHFHVAVAPQP